MLKGLLERFGLSKVEKEPTLFKGYDQAFREIVGSARTYLEYGCGRSTIWALENTECCVHSVDTSLEWIENTSSLIRPEDQMRANLIHIDLGDLTKWGRPVSYFHRDGFKEYFHAPWESSRGEADAVLIDGRFRVCCFLTSMLRARAGTPIIFDDYVNRANYHIVQDFFHVAKFCGRQAIFIAPGKASLPEKEIELMIRDFTHVMD